MEHKKQKNKTLKVILFLVIISIVILLGILFYNLNINKKGYIDGTFSYNQNVKYEFHKNGKGTLYDNSSKYIFKYTIENQNIVIDFKEDKISDATYEYTLNANTLILKGKAGTTGGEYTLNKENK